MRKFVERIVMAVGIALGVTGAALALWVFWIVLSAALGVITK